MKIDAKGLEDAAWEGVWRMFQTRHGPQDMPRLDDLKEANRSAMTWEEYLIAGRAAITAYLNAIEEAGFVVVPREPTEAMLSKGDERMRAWIPMRTYPGEYDAVLKDAYRSMLAAKEANREGP